MTGHELLLSQPRCHASSGTLERVSLLDLIAPPLCAGCGAHAGAAEPLCARCRGSCAGSAPSRSWSAGIEVWAPLAYEGPARDVVRALKFHGARGSSRAMAAQIAANAPPGWLTGGALVPVPLHPARARRRGYNQARLLAEALAERTGRPSPTASTRTGAARDPGRPRSRAQRLQGIAGGIRRAGRRAAASAMSSSTTSSRRAPRSRRAGARDHGSATRARRICADTGSMTLAHRHRA